MKRRLDFYASGQILLHQGNANMKTGQAGQPRSMAALLVFIGCCIQSFGIQAEDSVEAQLGEARFQRLAAIDEAATALKNAIDSRLRAVAQTGDLAAVKAIRAEQLAYQDDGKLPTSAELSRAVEQYLSARKQASTKLVVAYRAAVKECTIQLKIEQAEAIDQEMKRFIAEETKVLSRTAADTAGGDAELDKAKAIYDGEVKSARAKVTESLSSLARAAIQRGNRDLAKSYNQIIAHFESCGDLPQSQFIPVQRARDELEKELAAAGQKLSASYQQVIARHKAAKQNEEATKLTAELKRILDAGNIVAAARPIGVPEDAVTFNGNYYWFSQEKAKFDAAMAEAKRMKGRPLVITSAEENEFIAGQIAHPTLLGMRRVQGKWFNYFGQPQTFFAWQARGTSRFPNENIAAIKPGVGWDDYVETDALHYCVEWGEEK